MLIFKSLRYIQLGPNGLELVGADTEPGIFVEKLQPFLDHKLPDLPRFVLLQILDRLISLFNSFLKPSREHKEDPEGQSDREISDEKAVSTLRHNHAVEAAVNDNRQ